MFYFALAFFLIFSFFIILSIKSGLPGHELNGDGGFIKNVAGAVLICMGICTAVYLLLRSDSLAYPFEKSLTRCNCYEQMFDAFMKRQLYIDVQPSDELVLMGNPYDNALRKELDISFLWDRAYYSGHYYSYFGLTPLLLVYFPFYFITHTVPAPQTVCYIFALFTVPAVAALTVLLQKTFTKKLNPTLTLFSVLAVEGGSLVFMIQSSADNYYMPVQSGVLFLTLFLLTSLIAYRHKREAKKCSLFFFLSGICLVFLVMSRPNMAAYFLMCIPFYLSVLLDREIRITKKLASVLSFVVPVIIGAAFVMWYNKARFGSVLEFGTSYQLTVHDVRDYAYTPKLILPMLYYYFFKQPALSANLPYLLIPFVKETNYTKYLYVTSTVGALSFPSSWSVIFAPATLYMQKDRVKKGFLLTGILLIVFIAFTDICFGGVNLRYLADICLITTLLGTLVIADIYEGFIDKAGKQRSIAYTVICLAYLLSFMLGLMLILNNERDYIVEKYFGG